MRGAPVVGGVVPPACELRVVSGNGSPAHPRAARRARGPLVRPIGSLRIQVPRPWSPAAGNSPARVLSVYSGHPGKAPGPPDVPFGGGPIPLPTGLLASNDLPTAPRHTASSHYTRSVLTPRAQPRAELRYPCAPCRPDHAHWPRWLRLPAQKWRCFFARCQTVAKGANPGKRYRSRSCRIVGIAPS